MLNGEKTLSQTLHSIAGQTCRNFEVIVVDNGSTDQTRTIAKNFSGARYVYLPKKGRSLARNKGAELAVGSYLAFVDADVLLTPDWLESAERYLARLPLDALATRIAPQKESVNALDTYRNEFARWKSNGTYLSVLFAKVPYPLINTAACLISKHSFHRAGGFNTRLIRHEDLEFSIRLFAEGYFLGGTSAARAGVRFTAGSVIPKAREISYLLRSFEVQLRMLMPKGAKGAVNWALLKALVKKGPAPSLLGYAILVEFARYLGRLARFSHPARNSPEPGNIAGKNVLAFSFQHKKNFYFLHKEVNFIFINDHVYALLGTRSSKKLGRPAALAAQKLCAGRGIAASEAKALLRLGVFSCGVSATLPAASGPRT